MASRRPNARAADPYHRRHTHGRDRIALPPNPATGPQRRVPRTRRRLRRHARAPRSTRRRQQRFAADASHELRTPLAITQTLLDVARNDPNGDARELVDRLHAVNTRAIDLTEALLLLSRADQRSFARERVDLFLIAEEATEALLPLAEERGLTIETSGDLTPTVGSHALLLQLSTNLVHNAIVHNLPEHGTVWVTTGAHPKSVVLTVENTGEKLNPELVATLAEPFLRGTERIRTDHAGVGLGLALVKSITQALDGTLTLTPRAAGGLRATVQLPAAPATAGELRRLRRYRDRRSQAETAPTLIRPGPTNGGRSPSPPCGRAAKAAVTPRRIQEPLGHRHLDATQRYTRVRAHKLRRR